MKHKDNKWYYKGIECRFVLRHPPAMSGSRYEIAATLRIDRNDNEYGYGDFEYYEAKSTKPLFSEEEAKIECEIMADKLMKLN